MKLMPKGSFRKSKKNAPTAEEEPAEVTTSETKPAKLTKKKSIFGKMGLKKKDKSVKLTPSSNVRASIPGEDAEPQPEEVTPAPSAAEEEPDASPTDAPPAAETNSSAEDSPMEEEEEEPAKEEEEEEPMKEEDRDEEEPKEEQQQVAMDPAPVQTDDASATTPVQEAPSVTGERDQPEDDKPVNPLAGYLCGCV